MVYACVRCKKVYRTFTPLADKQKILEKLEEIAEELEEDMETNGWTGKTVTLKYKLDTYQGN
jgi:DNA polymerase kappa